MNKLKINRISNKHAKIAKTKHHDIRDENTKDGNKTLWPIAERKMHARRGYFPTKLCMDFSSLSVLRDILLKRDHYLKSPNAFTSPYLQK
jgi:hypothetical protein